MAITLHLNPELEAALVTVARNQGITPEQAATNLLRSQLTPLKPAIEPRDDWERGLLEIGIDCGVSLPNEALSSEGLYE